MIQLLSSVARCVDASVLAAVRVVESVVSANSVVVSFLVSLVAAVVSNARRALLLASDGVAVVARDAGASLRDVASFAALCVRLASRCAGDVVRAADAAAGAVTSAAAAVCGASRFTCFFFFFSERGSVRWRIYLAGFLLAVFLEDIVRRSM